MPSFEVVLFTLAALLVLVVFAVFDGPVPKQYRNRKCAGRLWRSAFPRGDKDSIRRFLDCFVDGMSFAPSSRLLFQPDDKVLDAYRAIYGGRVPFGDDMECERFADNLAEQFGIRLEEVEAAWHESVTLGELFGAVHVQEAA